MAVINRRYDYLPESPKEVKRVPRGYDYWPGPKLTKEEVLENQEDNLIKEMAQMAKDKEEFEKAKDLLKLHCTECKFVAKSDAGLKRHVTSMHKEGE
ncbi:MAG: hypothetical protein AB7P94_17390 [Steroidobacteraceae bacterium]